MDSVFTKIINGQIPCFKIAETDKAIAFLDIAPLAKGHTLVVPKIQIDKFFELPSEDYLSLMTFVKQVANAMAKALPCERIGATVIGLEVPHAHMHLIPISTMGDMDFFNPKLKLSPTEMESIAASIKNCLEY